ncbi:uncharacterized protein ACRADG_004983 isoform 2-T2 [Cochliomyia hominivorax]
MRSEDELQFIDALNSSDSNKFKGVCSKCLKVFTNRLQFCRHTKRNHCITKQKCPVCPVTFIDDSSLLNHLNLHRDNYFFCSKHCGANFATLPLCEEHELKEHKLKATPKIRYKHFCSFCREGFKTETQLHVHWLQQTQGCGKLMQDVVLHSTNVAKNPDITNNNKNSLLVEKQLTSATTNSVSTIPITKLRLKSVTTSSPATNKRPSDDLSDETTPKRLKMLGQIKSEVETNQQSFNYEGEVKIKEEPIDDYESQIPTTLIPEVIIKTEEEEEKITETEVKPPVMKSLFINNLGTLPSGKFIPLEHFVGNKTNQPNKEITTTPTSGKFIPLEQFVSTENQANEQKTGMKTFSINNTVKANVNGKIINTQNLPVLKLITNNNNNNINLNNTNNNNNASKKYIKLIPAPTSATNNNNMDKTNVFNNLTFSNLKNCSTGKIMTLRLAQPPQVNNNNNNNTNYNKEIKPLPKSGLQILKILPNSQVMSMKANGNLPNLSNGKPPIVIKLQTAPTIAKPKANLAYTSANTPPPLVLSTTTTQANIPANASNSTKSPSTSLPSVSISLNSLAESTTIDTEDFKKLQTEALIKAEEHRKNFYVPKTRLMIIENIPEKKQIIDSMKQQIAEVQTKTTEQIQGKPAGNFVLKTKNSDEPPSLYLPVLTTLDVSLVQARYQNPTYTYKWICPYCLKDYEIKTALKAHLNRAHNLNHRDMEKINVQAKPFLIEVTDEPESPTIPNDIKPQIKEEPITQDTDSQSLTISETESIIAENSSSISPTPKILKVTNIKPQRQRYVCDKCGRTCSSKTMLNDHILANCSREPQYACKECNKKFYSHGTLQCHMTIHTGELPHKCNYCDKRFRTRGQVKVHHRTHTGERPFFCQVCSQRFTHRETLIAHLSRHIGMKRYKCYGCDKHFSCISALKTHREIRADTCGKVKFNPRAIGPRVRVIRGNVIFEPQPEINPYLKSEDPKSVLSELQNQSQNSCSSSQSSQSS